jgi:tetratricopeptide (TPR) repeat protein
MESLSHKLNYKCYLVKGADAQSFIQSQSTNNFEALQVGCAQVSCLLNIKSQVESFFIVIKNETPEILVPRSNVEKFEHRFNQFLIMEDVELEAVEKQYYLNTESMFGNPLQYFSQLFTISEEPEKGDLPSNILAGLYLFPVWDMNIFSGDMLTDTILIDSATSFDKGCYLGQETVSKIYNNRGAAKFPAYVKTNQPLQNSILSFEYDNAFYNLIPLRREDRVEGKEFEGGVVHLIPYFDFSSIGKSYDLYSKAVDLFNSNNSEAAKSLLKKAIGFNPENADAIEVLGVILGREENFDEAIMHMNNLLEIDEKSVMAHTNLSLYYMKKGMIDQAEHHKDMATVNSFESAGADAQELRKKEEEIKRREGMFSEVLDIDPDDPLANYGMGDIYLEKKLYKKAIEKFVTVLNSDEKYSVAYVGLAKSLLGLNDNEAAKEVLEKGIEVASSQGDMMPANEMQAIFNRI